MSCLVIAEHDHATLKAATLNVIAAAAAIGGDIHVLVAGHNASAAAAAAAQVHGVGKVLLADGAAHAHLLPENAAAQVAAVAAAYSHILAPATAYGKGVAPRVAALLDRAQISDIIRVVDADTFVRPIYAGNAYATVKSSDSVKVLTVRGTAFAPAATTGGSAAVENVGAVADSGVASFVSAEITKSERPELTAAKIIVSGGRGLGSGEKYREVLTPLADKLNAAPSQPIIAFCNAGHWSATDWFVLSEVLGRPGVRMYPGSIIDWTSAPAPLPMDNEPGRWQQLRYAALAWAHRNLGTPAP